MRSRKREDLGERFSVFARIGLGHKEEKAPPDVVDGHRVGLERAKAEQAQFFRIERVADVVVRHGRCLGCAGLDRRRRAVVEQARRGVAEQFEAQDRALRVELKVKGLRIERVILDEVIVVGKRKLDVAEFVGQQLHVGQFDHHPGAGCHGLFDVEKQRCLAEVVEQIRVDRPA